MAFEIIAFADCDIKIDHYKSFLSSFTSFIVFMVNNVFLTTLFCIFQWFA